MSHLRKIRIEDAEAIAAAAREGEAGDASAYSIAAQFNAVRVGESPTFYFYDVNRADSPNLPGEFLADSYEELPGTARDFILESVYEDEDEIDGQLVTVSKRVKNRDVPDGATVLEADLVPHRFA